MTTQPLYDRVLTDHHWTDRLRGLREMRRVARRRNVLLQWDPATVADFWLTRDYLPSFAAAPRLSFARLAEVLGATRSEVVPIPHDCADGFLMAYWRRPAAYLDPEVRARISVFAHLDPGAVAVGLARLEADLASGRWHARHGELLERDAVDLGYRILVGEYDPPEGGHTPRSDRPSRGSRATMTAADRPSGGPDDLDAAREAELEASGGERPAPAGGAALDAAREAELEASGGEGPSAAGGAALDAAREAELEASGGEGPSAAGGGLLGAPEPAVAPDPDDLPVDPGTP